MEQLSKSTVLIVDDTEANLDLLIGILGDEFKVMAATDGPSAIEIAQERRPDIILLDIMMPGMDGYEVCSRLKAQAATRDIPVIFVTALDEVNNEVKGLKLGAVDYLTKPIIPEIVLARVKTHLLIKHQVEEILNKQKKITESIKAAGVIQQNLLPQRLPTSSRAAIAWKFQPCDAVGGDILNVIRLDQDHLGLYLLDVAGHGPPSAMISVLVYQLMNPHTGILIDDATDPPVIRPPSAVLDILDREFPLARFERHFTIIYMVADLACGKLTYANAGHCPPMLLRRQGALELLETSGTAIGIHANFFDQETVALHPGDKVVLYSDGIIEMRSPAEGFFGAGRFQNFLAKLPALGCHAVVEKIYDAVMQFADGRPPDDDLSVLLFEYKGEQQ